MNERANRIAHLLIKRGVKSQGRIGVLLERSADMLVTMLGIWKAGCAYVPLDPVYPAQRIQYMAEDAGLAALVYASEATRPAVGGETLLLSQKEIGGSLADYETGNPAIPVSDNALAYVIYTSGSTGNPKGVMVEHRNVANFFAGMDQRIEPGPGTWLAVTSISFDISVLDLFWTLCRGFKIVLYADERRRITLS